MRLGGKFGPRPPCTVVSVGIIGIGKRKEVADIFKRERAYFQKKKIY